MYNGFQLSRMERTSTSWRSRPSARTRSSRSGTARSLPPDSDIPPQVNNWQIWFFIVLMYFHLPNVLVLQWHIKLTFFSSRKRWTWPHQAQPLYIARHFQIIKISIYIKLDFRSADDGEGPGEAAAADGVGSCQAGCHRAASERVCTAQTPTAGNEADLFLFLISVSVCVHLSLLLFLISLFIHFCWSGPVSNYIWLQEQQLRQVEVKQEQADQPTSDLHQPSSLDIRLGKVTHSNLDSQ